MTDAIASLFDTAPTEVTAVDFGARYWRCDLQVHTPRDGRWPGTEPRGEDERRAVARTYLEAAQARGVDVVGITEHHDVSWIDELRYAAKGLDMHLLPGFEVEISDGIHVLCLFDPKRPVLELEDVLASLGLDRGRRAKKNATEIRAGYPLSEVLDIVQNRFGGICIAAHVTSRKGIFDLPPGGHARTHGSSRNFSQLRFRAWWRTSATRVCAACSPTRMWHTDASARWLTC